MLDGLGHDALVRRHDQQHQVDAADACQHVADEFLVTRHVDDADIGTIRRLHIRKAQFDRDAALLFLFQSVRVDARQGFDQAGLAVIHVSGGADDNVSHRITPKNTMAGACENRTHQAGS